MAFSYPVFLELEGRLAVVIGGGPIAEEKARGLADAGARVLVIAENPSPGMTALASAGAVDLLRRAFRSGDLKGAFIAISATGDPQLNSKIFAEAQRSRVLLNSADDPDHCHWSAPSVLRRGALAVAISTEGKAPALAKRLRERLEAEIGPAYGELVDLLGEVRAEMLPREVDFETWARRWRRAVSLDVLALVEAGDHDSARELVRLYLRGGEDGFVSLVGAGPGHPGLVTVAGRDRLIDADSVVYDRLVHPRLLELAPPEAERVFVGKDGGHGDGRRKDAHGVDQREVNLTLVDLARRGHHVVRLKGGDPFVFGRGGEEAEALTRAGVAFEVIPGVSSAVAAPAYAGIPITDRRFSSSVAVVTGHCAAPGQEVDWRALATAVDTIVVLMGIRRLSDICRALIEGGRSPDEPAAAVQWGSWPMQKTVSGRLADLPRAVTEAGLEPPAVVIVGEVVRLRETISTERNLNRAAITPTPRRVPR